MQEILQVPSIPLEQEQQEKEKVVKKKRTFFTLIAALLLAVVAFGLLLLSAFFIYQKYFAPTTPIIATPTVEQPAQQNPEIPVEKVTQYKSDNLKLSLEYPNEAKLIDTWDTSGQTKKLEIFFSKDTSAINNPAGIKDSEISEGYIFRISTFTTTIRNIDEISNVKKESIKSTCPETAEFADTYATQINGIDSRAFEVKNCNGDSTITYAPKFGVFYAFEQIYKGDLGYKQKQKAITQEILDSIRFYPEATAPVAPYEVYTNDTYKFSFEHPRFDSSCCDLAGPPIDTNTEKLVVLADKETFVSKTDFDGVAVYAYKLGNEGNYQDFLEKQKKTLVDDYIVVRGTQPKLQEIGIKVGDKNAVLLRGYSWRETDLVYADISGGTGGHYALIISIRNMTGDKFEQKVDRILSSFKFF